MPIYRLLNETAFEPEAINEMVRAYEDVLTDLELVDRNDPFTVIVAKPVIEVASRGVHCASDIRKQVLCTLERPR
jgi:hypothetical protein